MTEYYEPIKCLENARFFREQLTTCHITRRELFTQCLERWEERFWESMEIEVQVDPGCAGWWGQYDPPQAILEHELIDPLF